MKLKGIELNGTYNVIYYITSFVVYDERGRAIYFEDSDGYWVKSEYNEKGNELYSENSDGFWVKSEYDEKDKRTYYKDSYGKIIVERVKELTIEQIENLLGYKIKIKGE